ncbi:hypothetical protein GWI33_004249 [Rhynchophorus ferrugineus]|uniref:Uncharacterized protein n=1 Tax=Rhynchophorus ferrugineus TaxID=354439 RepID=A0A834IPS6_RHYFE|nr:hypothetical protein GWI33_004249 [Rhynchophorus ferrugineus]
MNFGGFLGFLAFFLLVAATLARPEGNATNEHHVKHRIVQNPFAPFAIPIFLTEDEDETNKIRSSAD